MIRSTPNRSAAVDVESARAISAVHLSDREVPKNDTQHALGATPKEQRKARSRAHRTNEKWLADLRGEFGDDTQQLAHADLSAYLYVVTLNYLQRKYAKSTSFTDLQEGDLATFAGDFIQDFMVKMLKENYALLDKYGYKGRFTSWVAQIVHNLIGSEMRKAYWRNETATTHDELHEMLCDEELSPEFLALRATVAETLNSCLAKLPDHYRIIIERCVLLGEPAVDIADEEKVSANSIYIRLHRAKERLRKLALAEGLEPNMLGV